MDTPSALLKIRRHLEVHVDTLTKEEGAELKGMIERKINAQKTKPQPDRTIARQRTEK